MPKQFEGHVRYGHESLKKLRLHCRAARGVFNLIKAKWDTLKT